MHHLRHLAPWKPPQKGRPRGLTRIVQYQNHTRQGQPVTKGGKAAPNPLLPVIDRAHRSLQVALEELSRMPEDEREANFVIRQTELNELASDLRTRARKSWKKPASFALSLAGSALSILTAPIAAALTIGGSLIGHEKPSETAAGAYS